MGRGKTHFDWQLCQLMPNGTVVPNQIQGKHVLDIWMFAGKLWINLINDCTSHVFRIKVKGTCFLTYGVLVGKNPGLEFVN